MLLLIFSWKEQDRQPYIKYITINPRRKFRCMWYFNISNQNYQGTKMKWNTITYPLNRDHAPRKFSPVQILDTLGCFIRWTHCDQAITSRSGTLGICDNFGTFHLKQISLFKALQWQLEAVQAKSTCSGEMEWCLSGITLQDTAHRSWKSHRGNTLNRYLKMW